MAAPDDHWPLSSEARAALLCHASCVLGQSPLGLAIPGGTFSWSPLAAGPEQVAQVVEAGDRWLVAGGAVSLGRRVAGTPGRRVVGGDRMPRTLSSSAPTPCRTGFQVPGESTPTTTRPDRPLRARIEREPATVTAAASAWLAGAPRRRSFGAVASDLPGPGALTDLGRLSGRAQQPTPASWTRAISSSRPPDLARRQRPSSPRVLPGTDRSEHPSASKEHRWPISLEEQRAKAYSQCPESLIR